MTAQFPFTVTDIEESGDWLWIEFERFHDGRACTGIIEAKEDEAVIIVEDEDTGDMLCSHCRQDAVAFLKALGSPKVIEKTVYS